jgi:5-methyltetrahydrofolate--homocysteine methyltransferase
VGSQLLERITRGETLVSDGAMGTMLFSAGLTGGGCPELWNRERPDLVRDVYRGYFEAGSDFVCTNTFGGTRPKLEHYELEGQVVELNRLGISLAREVCPPGRSVVASIGPTGKFMEPVGELSYDQMRGFFREQIEAVAEAGADAILVETMMDLEEASVAVRVAKEATRLPVLATMTFDQIRDGTFRTLFGNDPAQVVQRLTEAGADVVGCNCVNGPAHAAGILQAMRAASETASLMGQPNAGLPQIVNGECVYVMTPAVMMETYPQMIASRPSIVGGCCGTTPAHLRLIADLVKGRQRAAAARP